MSRFHSALLAAASMALVSPATAQRSGGTPVLDTVRVTSRGSGGLVASMRSVQVIGRAQLRASASRSLADVLGHALGADVQQRSPAQADLGLRGSTYNQVVVLVDGVRVSDVQSGHYALDLAMPLAMIERVEILRGTGSALYGSDAIGGVVNIVTRTDTTFTDLGTRAGSFGGARAAAALARAPGGFQLRGGIEMDRSRGHRAGTDHRITQLRGAAARTIGSVDLVADAGLGARQFGAADFYSPFPSHETTRSTTATLRATTPETERLSVTAAVHTRRHSDVFTLKRNDPAFYQNRHLAWQSGVETAVRTRLSPMLSSTIGAELLDARLRSARLGDHEQQRRALFGEATVGRAGSAALNVGLRGDWSTDVGAFASPSIGAVLPLGRAAQLRASAGRGFRAPTWTERFYRDPANIGDSTLQVERFSAGEIGARLTPVPWLSADVALFERRAESLIDWARPAGSPTTTPWRTMNFAQATYRGVEATIAMPGVLGIDWELRGSGLRFDAGVRGATVGKYALRPVTRTAGVSALAPLGGGRSASFDLLRARRTGERDHVQLDARIDQAVRGVRLSLELLNLTDADYLDVSGKPVASRSAFVGIAWPGR